MITVTHDTEPADGTVCACCGKPIRHLADPESLTLFLRKTTLQRRFFLCLNCGRVVCDRCGANNACGICRSNAWIAIPCLEQPPAAAHKPPGNRGPY